MLGQYDESQSLSNRSSKVYKRNTFVAICRNGSEPSIIKKDGLFLLYVFPLAFSICRTLVLIFLCSTIRWCKCDLWCHLFASPTYRHVAMNQHTAYSIFSVDWRAVHDWSIIFMKSLVGRKNPTKHARADFIFLPRFFLSFFILSATSWVVTANDQQH